jgi:hypothetical protein
MVSVGSCPIGKVTWACKLTTHLYQVLGVRLSGSVPLLVLCAFMVCIVTVLSLPSTGWRNCWCGGSVSGFSLTQISNHAPLMVI